MSELDNFFAEIPTEGKPFGEEGGDPAESQPAKQEENNEPPQGGDEAKADNTPDEKKVDFHEHPRFKALIEERNAMKAQIEELLPLKEKFNSLETRLHSNQDASIPQWFSSVYGDSPEVWQLFQQHSQQEKAAWKQEVLNEIEQSRQQQIEEQSRWDNWVKTEIDALKSEGLNFDKNKLIKIATEYQPTDSEGNISLRKAYDILKIMEDKSEKSEARKQIAATTTQTSNAEFKKKDYVTPADLRKMDWRTLK